MIDDGPGGICCSRTGLSRSAAGPSRLASTSTCMMARHGSASSVQMFNVGAAWTSDIALGIGLCRAERDAVQGDDKPGVYFFSSMGRVRV